MTLTIWKPAALFALLALPLYGEIIITPSSPTAQDAVTVSVENHFGAAAQVASASINQVGNAFTIAQNVDYTCSLPADPLVASQFVIGPQAPGTYTVTANITFNGQGFPNQPCTKQPVQQTTTFVIAPPVPVFDPQLLGLLAVVFGVIGASILRRT